MKKKAVEKTLHASEKLADREGFTYDPELDKYKDVVLFPEKVAKAKEAIKHPSLRKLLDSLKEKNSR